MRGEITKASRVELLQLLYDSRRENQALAERARALEEKIGALEERAGLAQAADSPAAAENSPAQAASGAGPEPTVPPYTEGDPAPYTEGDPAEPMQDGKETEHLERMALALMKARACADGDDAAAQEEPRPAEERDAAGAARAAPEAVAPAAEPDLPDGETLVDRLKRVELLLDAIWRAVGGNGR